ncbi:hypothetical protein HWV62_16892 [Athelia sp. TMB]|nr:hypothetical protein HWV62_16892 [Athelia sp. TMB]
MRLSKPFEAILRLLVGDRNEETDSSDDGTGSTCASSIDRESIQEETGNFPAMVFGTTEISGNATVINVNGDYYDVKATSRENSSLSLIMFDTLGADISSLRKRDSCMDESSRCLPELQCGTEEAPAGDWGMVLTLAGVTVPQVEGEFWISCMAAWRASSVIENIVEFCEQKPTSRGYAYFFFDGTRAQTETLTYESLLRSVISQLSDRCGDNIPNVLLELYNKCDGGHRQPTETQLEDTLARILGTFGSTYIIIDSLDECAEKADLLRWIESMTSQNPRNLHLMLTSRPEADIEQGLASLRHLKKVTVGDGSTEDDIAAYLDARLKAPDMNKWDQAEKQMIKASLFRWVGLQVDAISKCRSKQALKEQLNSLPKGLDATYTQIFERSECPDYLERLLQWILFSKRQLTVEELAEVLAVDINSGDVPFYNPDMRCQTPAVIWTICNGLVTEFKGTVKLAHFSVKEYLIVRIRPEAEAQSSTSEQLSHSVIAQDCLAQLLHFDEPSVLDWGKSHSLALDYIGSLFPLAQYAAMNWVSHFQSSASAPAHCLLLQNLLLRLFKSPPDTWSHALLCWVRLQNLVIRANAHSHLLYEDTVWGRTVRSFREANDLPLDVPPLYYACFSGSFHAVQHLINNGADVNKAGQESSTRPILLACAEGHLEIARLLLDGGANFNAEGGWYHTALQVAIARGHLELANLLLDKGADVSLGGGYYGSALQAASARGYFELAKLLLDKGVNVNLEGGYDGSALQAASADGHLELVKLLLDKGAHVNVEGGVNGSALQAASAGGHLELAKLLLDKGSNVNVGGGSYGSALQAASAGGHLELAKLLLGKGSDVNVGGGRYASALQTASQLGHLELAKLLLDKGAHVNVEEGRHSSALYVASTGGHLELAKLLLDKGANVNLEGEHGCALQAASAKGHLELAKLLLDKGANANVEGGQYGSALQAASAGGHLELAKLLLDKGANTNVEVGQYGSALQAASRFGHLELAKLLLDRGANVNFEGRHYGSALQAASAFGHLELAKLLLDNGANTNVEVGQYGSALRAASRLGHLELAKLLLDRGANVNFEGRHYGSALQAASAEGHLELAKLLLNEGANINLEGGEDGSALLAASAGGHLELVKLLLDNGAGVNVEVRHYGSVLQWASARGHLELAKLLLDNGANVNGGRYGSALQAASAGGHLELAKLLLDKGANANVNGGRYGSALQAASAGGHLELAKLLLDKGANTNVEGGQYGSALQAASVFGHLELAKLLLDKGANVNAKAGWWEHTALQHASKQGHAEIAQLLREHRAVESEDD